LGYAPFSLSGTHVFLGYTITGGSIKPVAETHDKTVWFFPFSAADSVYTSLEQPISENEVQPMLFSPEKEVRFQKRFEEGYDVQYEAWVQINHPELRLSVDNSSSVSATSSANHVKASSSPSCVEQNDVLSDILVRPKPKEISRRKRIAGICINQKSVKSLEHGTHYTLKSIDTEKAA
jgi:hypothetical protein